MFWEPIQILKNHEFQSMILGSPKRVHNDSCNSNKELPINPCELSRLKCLVWCCYMWNSLSMILTHTHFLGQTAVLYRTPGSLIQRFLKWGGTVIMVEYGCQKCPVARASSRNRTRPFRQAGRAFSPGLLPREPWLKVHRAASSLKIVISLAKMTCENSKSLADAKLAFRCMS